MATYRYPSLPLERWQIEQGWQSDPSGAPTRPWKEWSDWERYKYRKWLDENRPGGGDWTQAFSLA